MLQFVFFFCVCYCFFFFNLAVDRVQRQEREVMLKLKEVVDKQRDEIRAKAQEISSVSKEVEAVWFCPLHIYSFFLFLFLDIQMCTYTSSSAHTPSHTLLSKHILSLTFTLSHTNNK